MKSQLWRTAGARAGDRIILTKPIGTGIAITAIKADMIEDEATRTEAIESMRRLNMIDLPPELHGQVHAATDVTGFGLAGHLHDMLDENLDFGLFVQSIPSIAGVKELADMGLVPEGAYRNQSAYESFVDAEGSTFARSDIDMLYDAQTSGGLLLAVRPEVSETVLEHVRNKGFGRAEVIGEFRAGTGRIKLC
jgi:selenide,water dikinase